MCAGEGYGAWPSDTTSNETDRDPIGDRARHGLHLFALAIRDQQQDVNPVTDDSRRLQRHEDRGECDRVMEHVAGAHERLGIASTRATRERPW